MIDFGKDVVIEDGAIVNVKSGHIGDRSIIRSGARLEGTFIELGTESYVDHGAIIGGGSCWDKGAYLKTGCWLHLGWNAQINIGRGVDIGDEVGLGAAVFTHGGYLPIDQGFPIRWGPVKIGNRVWMPNGVIVLPNVTIGDNVVVASGSVVNRDLPCGCFAGGSPAKIIRENAYPKKTHIFLLDVLGNLGYDLSIHNDEIICYKQTKFNLPLRVVDGEANDVTESIKNQLRRNGIRFKYYAKDGKYAPWE